ncbi:hypothetical protein ACHAXN_006275 [Cyclotella atomus]
MLEQPRQRQTLESNLQPSGESYQKCITDKCDKKLKDEKKTIECQQQCNTSYPDSTRSGTFKYEYKKESKDSTDSEAESEAKEEYKSCLKKCFPNDSNLTVLKGTNEVQ